jgi:hypothetical protein
MRTSYKVILAGLGVFGLIQFIPRNHNNAPELEKHPLFTDYPTSHTVENVIRFACADCHSNHTEYPWYAKIQPVSMWIDHHVDEGKEHFNIDAWNTYSRKQQKHKIEECIEVIEEGEMPMKGYVKMHERANLTALQKKEITLWAKGLIDSMGRRN